MAAGVGIGCGLFYERLPPLARRISDKGGRRKLSEHTFRTSRPMFPSGPRYIVITKRLALGEGYDILCLSFSFFFPPPFICSPSFSLFFSFSLRLSTSRISSSRFVSSSFSASSSGFRSMTSLFFLFFSFSTSFFLFLAFPRYRLLFRFKLAVSLIMCEPLFHLLLLPSKRR